jgi:uncharacterized membrane protein YesL
MKYFSYESPFSQVLIRITFSCWLNVLWFVCSIPIVTVGASTTALYAVSLKIAAGEESNLTKSFFSSFRSNFKQSTRLWLILLAAGILLGLDGYIVSHLRSTSTGPIAVMWTLNLALLIAAAIVLTVILIYIFPLIARYANTDIAMIKNSLLAGFRYLFCTIMVFAIHFAMFFAVVALFTPLVIFGEGLCALASSYFLLNVFRTFAQPEE